MSRSAILCKECGNTVAWRHHSGRIRIEVGIRVVILTNGIPEVECPCSHKQAVLPERLYKAA